MVVILCDVINPTIGAVLKRNRSTLSEFVAGAKDDLAWDDDEDYEGNAVY